MTNLILVKNIQHYYYFQCTDLRIYHCSVRFIHSVMISFSNLLRTFLSMLMKCAASFMNAFNSYVATTSYLSNILYFWPFNCQVGFPDEKKDGLSECCSSPEKNTHL